MNDSVVYFYVLFEEGDDDNVRYVGRTVDVQQRFYAHMADTGNTHKAHWVQSLRAINKRIAIKVVETVTNATEEELQMSEQFWINLYQMQGCSLTNLDFSCAGGGKKSEVTKERIAAAQRGRTFTQEHKEKLSQAKKTPEAIARIVEKNKCRIWTPEQRKQSSESHKGRKATPEQRERQRIAVTKWWAERKGVSPEQNLKRIKLLAEL